VAIGTTIRGGGLGLPVFQYSQTMKKDGVLVREAFFKHWKNASPRNRPWSCLRFRYGLQVSVCTGNSRRVELFELLAGGALKELMRSDPNYPNEPWRVDFEKIRDPAELIRFQANKPAEREHFQQYIIDCLEVLMGTIMASLGRLHFHVDIMQGLGLQKTTTRYALLSFSRNVSSMQWV
jgi:hypothetical protein